MADNEQRMIMLAQAFRLFLIGSVIWVLPGLLPSFIYDLDFILDCVNMASSLFTSVFFILSIIKTSKALQI